MSTPRIQRGAMVAEVLERDYTRIGNRLIRDSRLSFKAKGVFAWMASHKDGFGVSPESIAAAGVEGISAVKSALRELEAHGYLTRSQGRTADGTMGQTVYSITDMPSSEPVDGNRPADVTSGNTENRRSEPVDGYPSADEPPAVNHPHKKTIPLEEDQLVEDELSLPSVPAQRTAESESAPDERETSPSSSKPTTAQEVVRAAGILTDDENETAFITWATQRYNIRSGGLWRTVATNGDLADWVTTWRAKGSQASAQILTGADVAVAGWLALANDLRAQEGHQPARPNDTWDRIGQQAAAGARPAGWEQVPHCDHPGCNENTRYRTTFDANGDASVGPCPECHPALRF